MNRKSHTERNTRIKHAKSETLDRKSYIVHTSYLASRKEAIHIQDWTNRERSSAATQADTLPKDADPNGISQPIPNHAIRHPESEKSERKKRKKKPAQIAKKKLKSERRARLAVRYRNEITREKKFWVVR